MIGIGGDDACTLNHGMDNIDKHQDEKWNIGKLLYRQNNHLLQDKNETKKKEVGVNEWIRNTAKRLISI